MRHVRRAFTAAVILAVAVCFTGCNDTHDARCNEQFMWRVNSAIGDHGWTLRCDPTSPDLQYNPPSWVQGYADPTNRVAALWPDRIDTDDLLRKTADHELGHIVGIERGTDSEVFADGYAWCFDPILGLSYFNTPTDCSSYL